MFFILVTLQIFYVIRFLLGIDLSLPMYGQWNGGFVFLPLLKPNLHPWSKASTFFRELRSKMKGLVVTSL